MGFYSLMSVLIISLVVFGMYEIKKKNEVKLAEIKLEREKVALEHKQLEMQSDEVNDAQ